MHVWTIDGLWNQEWNRSEEKRETNSLEFDLARCHRRRWKIHMTWLDNDHDRRWNRNWKLNERCSVIHHTEGNISDASRDAQSTFLHMRATHSPISISRNRTIRNHMNQQCEIGILLFHCTVQKSVSPELASVLFSSLTHFHTRQNGFSTMRFIDIRTQWKICHSAFETKSIDRLHRFENRKKGRTTASPVKLLAASKSIQSKTKSSERNTICRNLNNQRVHATQTQPFEGAQHSPFRVA